MFVFDGRIVLAHKEYELLYFLARHKEMVFSKEQLYDNIWDADRYGDMKTVALHIKRLREKIEQDPTNPLRIQTVCGAGYRLMA